MADPRLVGESLSAHERKPCGEDKMYQKSKKWRGIAAATVATGLLAILSTTGSASPTDGLVAAYPFDGNADDVSGNGNDAAITGAQLTADRFDVENAAYTFDGQDDKIQVASSADLDITDGITLAAWVRPVETKTQFVIRKGAETSAPYFLALAGNGDIVFSVSPGGRLRKSGYTLDVWTLLVATWDGSTMTLYENGVAVASAPQSGTIPTNDSPLLIGTRLQLPADTFHGDLDEIMIWDRALAENEVAGLMMGPAATYPFAGDASDVSPNGNDGAVSGAVLTADRFGVVNSAYSFDGQDDKIQAPSSASLEITGPITIGAWIRPMEQKTQTILRKGSSTVAPYALGLSGTGVIAFGLNLDGGVVQLRKTGYTLDQWTFIAATWDCTTMRLYENGVLVGSAPASGALATNVSPLLIGTRLQLPSSTFRGDLDEVMVWRGALTESQVVEIMGDAPTPVRSTTWGAIKTWHQP